MIKATRVRQRKKKGGGGRGVVANLKRVSNFLIIHAAFDSFHNFKPTRRLDGCEGAVLATSPIEGRKGVQ
jgi:hypothetical protein